MAETDAGRELHAQQQGIAGTVAQGVYSFVLRRARYRGLAKTRLHRHVASATAFNLDRPSAGQPLAETRIFSFARLAA